MTLEELLKKPVEIVIENNISEDVVKPADTIHQLSDKVVRLLSSDDTSGFLLVYTDNVENNYPVKAIITYRDLEKFLPLITNASNVTSSLDTLNLERDFPVKYTLKKTDIIEKAFELFKSDLTDIIIVLDEHEKYIGKIKLKPFISRIRLLIS